MTYDRIIIFEGFCALVLVDKAVQLVIALLQLTIYLIVTFVIVFTDFMTASSSISSYSGSSSGIVNHSAYCGTTMILLKGSVTFWSSSAQRPYQWFSMFRWLYRNEEQSDFISLLLRLSEVLPVAATVQSEQ